MANPQKQNGYTSIANELVEALCRIRISGEARQIIDTVIRKTYGFNKKQDAISLSQFCVSTGMRRSDVCRALNKAKMMNIIKTISKKANGIGNIYSINKDFDTWKPLAKKPRGVAKKQITISKKANNHTQKSDIQKTVTKETITKDILRAKELPAVKQSNDLLGDSQKHIQIIGLYAAYKKVIFENNEHLQNYIKRNVRAAKSLIPYEGKKIAMVMEYLNIQADFKWTLESVSKYIDDPAYMGKTINQIKERKGITI